MEGIFDDENSVGTVVGTLVGKYVGCGEGRIVGLSDGIAVWDENGN